MTTRNVLYLLLAAFLSASLQFSCSSSVSGVETTNGITVVATTKTIEGTAPPYSQVYLFDTSYIPYIDIGTGFGTSVDLDGSFEFSVSPGTYNILVITRDRSEAGILQKTVSPDISGSDQPEKNTLKKTGSVSGSVAAASEETILVYLAGTSYYQIFTGSSSFAFHSVPSGKGLLRCAVISTEESVGRYSAETVADLPIDLSPGAAFETGVISLE
jgi:hypothetical protein